MWINIVGRKDGVDDRAGIISRTSKPGGMETVCPFLIWVPADRGRKVGLVLREERDPVVREHPMHPQPT